MEFSWKSWLSRFSWDHPYILFGLVAVVTVVMVYQFPAVKINTDPEDMLPREHPARVRDRKIESNFFLHDMVAIAIEPPELEREITPRRLERVYKLVRKIKKKEGVISEDILSLYTSDDIEGFGGGINVDRFLRKPPQDQAQVDKLIKRVEDHPVLKNMILNRGSGGIALFVPIKEKSHSYQVRQLAHKFWADQPESAGKIHVTGLPVAETTFGVQMFYQMATSAPLAFIVIGLLMLLFFRSFSLVFWSLLQAVVTVVWIMGSLIGLGYTVHIMSSMIPIFLLPVAVVDSIHILSDFSDRSHSESNNREVLAEVYEDIFYPILFTSLTSAAGFISLAMTGIPPVQVFGVAVGVGILLAFLTTITVIPAGARLWTPHPESRGKESWIGQLVHCSDECGCLARDYPKIVISLGLIIVLAGLYGMSLIQVNDNPTRWFHEQHPIRQADRYLNQAFVGSYPAYLVLEKSKGGWYEPQSLQRLEKLQTKIQALPNVGKVTTISGIVNKIHRELHAGQVKTQFPDTARAVQQYLFLFQNSGNPQDLFRLISSDGNKVNIWFNLKSGDNRIMARVKEMTNNFVNHSDLKLAKKPKWGGITVVNLTWQNVMVRGMAWALAGSYLVIFVMLLLLFRSFRWAFMALVPLTFTLVSVYGLIGWIGKDYDMPVAVLSALSIGIAVDFAIHFIQRGRQIIEEEGSWPQARERIVGEPARAIARNGVVIAIGFSPLLVSPLRPYVTVGVFMMLIMAFAGISTLIGLYAIFESFHPFLPTEKETSTSLGKLFAMLNPFSPGKKEGSSNES